MDPNVDVKQEQLLLELYPFLTRASCMCLSQKEHCGATPNHVQTQALAALQHHPLLPPHLPHLGADLYLVGDLVQGARPTKVGVSIREGTLMVI